MPALDDPTQSPARLRVLLARELERSADELHEPRPGRREAVVVVCAAGPCLVLPVPASVRSDPGHTTERGWALAGAALDALTQAADGPLATAAHDGWLVLTAAGGDVELLRLALDEGLARVDRLRVRTELVSEGVLDLRDARPPAGRLAGEQPAKPAGPPLPHDDPDPRRRVARRMLQTLVRKGKWGGFHTEFTHLARGFEGNDRRLAEEVGESLLRAGLLGEKLSVGQRHVFLQSGRARDIRALVDEGVVPLGLELD